ERVPFLLSDTVGFIRKLPHHLIESFKSTLDEVRESDIILHVVDIAHPRHEEHLQTVNTTLKSLGVTGKPTLIVFNKMDLYRQRYFDDLVDAETKEEIERELRARLKNQFEHDNVFISATEKENIDLLKEKLLAMIKRAYQVRYPYQAQGW
ncbi:MAG TPA: GTPase HflX, partial [Bacteroidetes bacterium]|nr:GTPase HflX [Bacteroidota bacterium]